MGLFIQRPLRGVAYCMPSIFPAAIFLLGCVGRFVLRSGLLLLYGTLLTQRLRRFLCLCCRGKERGRGGGGKRRGYGLGSVWMKACPAGSASCLIPSYCLRPTTSCMATQVGSSVQQGCSWWSWVCGMFQMRTAQRVVSSSRWSVAAAGWKSLHTFSLVGWNFLM